MRTYGAYDKRKRKRRNDIGKQRKIYAGVPVKKKKKVNGSFVPYVSKRNRDDPIKIAFFKIDRMPLESYMHFNKKLRRHIRRVIYGKPPGRIYTSVDQNQIGTKEKLGQFCINLLWEGRWLIKFPSHCKNKMGVSFNAKGIVILTETSQGMKAKIITSWKPGRSLSRYWWWKE